MRNSFVVFSNFISRVGKTTLAILFARVLAATGKRVLAVDSDPNQNLTMFRFAEHSLLWDRPIASGIWHGDADSGIAPSLVINTDILHETDTQRSSWRIVIDGTPEPRHTNQRSLNLLYNDAFGQTFDNLTHARIPRQITIPDSVRNCADVTASGKTKLTYDRLVELTSEIIGEVITPYEGCF